MSAGRRFGFPVVNSGDRTTARSSGLAREQLSVSPASGSHIHHYRHLARENPCMVGFTPRDLALADSIAALPASDVKRCHCCLLIAENPRQM